MSFKILDNFLLNSLKTIYSYRRRKYHVTDAGFEVLFSLRPSSQKLFLKILRLNKYNTPYIELHYSDLGYVSYKNFHRYRKPLIDCGLIAVEDDNYVINPIYVETYYKRLKEELYLKFGITKSSVPLFARHRNK